MHMTLAEFMEIEKLTDASLAEKVGRDRSNVTRWRRGDTKPDFEALVAIEKMSGGKVTALDFSKENAA
jgi:transcriptional regulator with XRE-family HTH domain